MKKILIVDDELEILELISSFFEESGWQTQTAASGKIALEAIKNFEPSVIISDINMPDMDGLELLEHLFATNNLTPVVLLTGFRDSAKMQRAWSACVFEFLDKPAKFEKLLQVAESAFTNGTQYVAVARKRYERQKKNQAA